MRSRPGLVATVAVVIASVAGASSGVAAPEGQMTWAVHTTLVPSWFPSVHWLTFADQFDPKSPWHDKCVRLAANLALDRHTLNEAATLGLSKVSGSIVPSSFDFFWPAPLYPYDAARARRLLAEAGYPSGFDAGQLFCDLQVCPWAEALLTHLKAVGIQLKPARVPPRRRPARRGVRARTARRVRVLRPLRGREAEG